MTRATLSTGRRPPPFASDGTLQLVVFRIDEQRYSLRLSAVDRIVRAVSVTPLPEAPPAVLGVIDVEGRVLPVFNLRRRLQLSERSIDPADQFVIARTKQRTVVLSIDEAEGLIERPIATIAEAMDIVPGVQQIRGVVQLDDGLVFIQDLDRFLSLEEEHALDDALTREASHES